MDCGWVNKFKSTSYQNLKKASFHYQQRNSFVRKQKKCEKLDVNLKPYKREIFE